MSKAKIAIALEEESIAELDRLVSEHVFQNRSQAIQDAKQVIYRNRHGSR